MATTSRPAAEGVRPASSRKARRSGPAQWTSSTAHSAAHVIAAHPEQGWSLLCNGIVLFDDLGELLPDGRALAPPRVDFAARIGRVDR